MKKGQGKPDAARKPRADSVLFKQLTPEQQALVAGWLIAENQTYEQVQERIWLDFNLRVSRSAVARFYQHAFSAHRSQALTERIRSAAEQANEYIRLSKEAGAEFDAAIMGRIKQRIFERSLEDSFDEKMLDAALDNFTRWRTQDIKVHELKLKRDRFEFDASKACLEHLPSLRKIASDSKLDENAKIDAVRAALFGSPPKQKEQPE